MLLFNFKKQFRIATTNYVIILYFIWNEVIVFYVSLYLYMYFLHICSLFFFQLCSSDRWFKSIFTYLEYQKLFTFSRKIISFCRQKWGEEKKYKKKRKENYLRCFEWSKTSERRECIRIVCGIIRFMPFQMCCKIVVI